MSWVAPGGSARCNRRGQLRGADHASHSSAYRPPEVDQLVVRAVLDDAAVVHHQDLIGVDGL